MKTANLDVEMLANSPTPETLQQMKDGDIDAALGLDLATIGWTAMDSLARLSHRTGSRPGRHRGHAADAVPHRQGTARRREPRAGSPTPTSPTDS